MKDTLSKSGAIVGLLVGSLTLLTAAGTAAIKLAGVETNEAHAADMEKLRQERAQIITPIAVELRYTRGLVECQSRGIKWEDCPTVQNNPSINATSPNIVP